FVYFHQSLVFENAAWSWTDAQQRTLWFYAHVYPWAVRCFLHADTRVFVQLEGIKNSFAQKFGHDPDKIITVFPTVGPPMSPSDDDTPLDASVLRLFYPALPFAYKNHQVLCEALPQLGRPCRLYLTTPPVPGEGRPELVRLGQLDKAQMARLYHQCDALVFPSKVETFGLPLLEAALCGLPVIAADKPYARDVLAGYEGARFVDADDPAAWAAAIGALRCGVRYRPIDVSGRRSWDYLFEQLWKK
ncbi:MAG: glycosyltransferase, partial [Paludibacteraceae bacterium]|nr:glycosyltransferase [Paludibacteraceae bacterium]